jgi:single-strand DNA-binding protein
VQLIGRMTRKPELRTFDDGGAVVNFGFAVNNNRWNKETQQWDSVAVFVDCKAFDARDKGKRQLASMIARTDKGEQHFVEGHLVMETWNDKDTGAKRMKLVVHVDNFQFLTAKPREDGEEGGHYERRPQAAQRPAQARPHDRPAPQGQAQGQGQGRPRPAPASEDGYAGDDYGGYTGSRPGSHEMDEEDNIPF